MYICSNGESYVFINVKDFCFQLNALNLHYAKVGKRTRNNTEGTKTGMSPTCTPDKLFCYNTIYLYLRMVLFKILLL